MNTQAKLKNILATSEFIFDNYENVDNYYKVVLAETIEELNKLYTRYYMNGEYNIVVVPLGVAGEFFEGLDYSENYESVKDLNPNNLIMINFNDDYIYTNEDINNLYNDIKEEREQLKNE